MELELVHVEMDDVELLGELATAPEHQHEAWDRLADGAFEPQRRRHAHERGYVIESPLANSVTLWPDRLLGEIGNDTLGAAESRGGTLSYKGAT